MFAIVHKDSLGTDITNTSVDTAFDDETDAGDMLVRYIRMTDINPGDTLTISEV